MSIFSNNKPVKHVGRTGFDLSSDHVFDMRAGVVRPVVCIDTVPNSSYRINCSDLVRTGALQTAAFLRGRQELDFFFVPYSQIYSNFNDIVFGRSDDHSLWQQQSSKENIPKYYLVQLVYAAAVQYYVEFVCRNMFAAGYSFFEILDRLGFDDDTERSFFIDSFTYNNFVPVESSTFESLSFIGGDSFKLLSTLEYGDFLLSFENALHSEYGSDYDWLVFDNSYFFPVTQLDNNTVILEWLISCVDSHVTINNGYVYGDKLVSPLRLKCYQKIWHDVYRDSIIDDSSDYVYAFNSDYDTDIITEGQILLSGPHSAFFTSVSFARYDLRPRLRQYAKDLSSGLYPEPQYGRFGELGDLPDENSPVGTLPSGGGALPGSAFSIRFALAMQRYKETLLRAGNRAKDLLMSEFGVQSKYIHDTYVQSIGSFGGALDLNKVSATAETGDYSVGDLAGNVFSSLQGDTIDFTCNDYGVIIGVMSFIATPLHNAFGISPFNTKYSQFDFYHEAFENLGLAPVAGSNFSNFKDATETLGFSARYYEYKQKLDCVHDSFCTVPPVAYQHGNVVAVQNDGYNSNYVCVRPTLQVLGNQKDRSYMLPSCMNTIFKSYDNGQLDGSHFQCYLSVNVSAVLPMSQLGLPY